MIIKLKLYVCLKKKRLLLGVVKSIVQMCVFQHHQATDSTLTLPRDSIRSDRLRAQSSKTLPHPFRHTNSKSRLSPVLLIGYRSEVPMAPSLGLINLPIELKIYLLVYQFIIKEYNLATAR